MQNSSRNDLGWINLTITLTLPMGLICLALSLLAK